MKNKRNFIINFLIIIFVLVLVLFFSLRDNFDEIMGYIFNMNPLCFVGAIITLCVCRALMAYTHYNVIKLNNENVSYYKCLLLNFIVLFFHGITPFSGGGQPMEVYFLHKEKIRITKATNITLQNFIIYQIAFVFIGVLALIYNSYFDLFPNDHLIKKLVVLGFSINIIVLVGTFILSFCRSFSKFISEKIIHLIYGMKLIKDEDAAIEKINGYLESFYNNALELGKHKRVVFKILIVDFLAILTLYSMPYFVALGFGINLNMVQVFVTTAYVMTIGSFVPIPGGTGGIEYGFIFFYGYLVRGNVVNAIMLIWRFVSYYFGMILGAIALSLSGKKENI